MPVRISKHQGGYSVHTPGGVKAKHTTETKAKRQTRLLRALEYNPEWEPTGKPAKKPAKKR